ncbi:MAG: 50S ribosomal protein L3 N(5)-glutamine methyltransferase [Xanthobacteraceae bacterium]
MPAKTSKSPPHELVTILDFVRYAASRFTEAKLAFGQGTRDAVEDAMFLVCEALHLPKENAEAFLPARLTAAERRHVFGLIEKRVDTRTPAAYLVKRAYLQDHAFTIDERAIVPRSYLAELLYSELFTGEEQLIDRMAVTRVLDLCTGSGCLAILACEVFPNARVDAVDVSKDPLAVAKINVAEHGVEERVRLTRGDLFKPVGDSVYDIILCNPPYVDAEGMARLPKEYRHEPRLALAAGADGLDIVRRILGDARRHLSDDGGLLCEIGRCRPALEASFPETNFLWLDTAEASGEVFWLPAAALE